MEHSPWSFPCSTEKYERFDTENLCILQNQGFYLHLVKSTYYEVIYQFININLLQNVIINNIFSITDRTISKLILV